mgnify:CR=1 FL=1
MLTSFDKALLNILQTNLPLSEKPFKDLADKLDSTEENVIKRLNELKEMGYIRKIGLFFDSAKLGYQGTLVATKVLPEYMESVATAINEYNGVTHNYEREGDYNLWFTLITIDMEQQDKILNHIKSLPGVLDIISLPANKKYKVSVNFTLK